MALKSEITRGRLLQSTVYCITHFGIERTSHTEIARHAKVSRSLVAHYFPEKDKIFPEIVRFIASEAYLFFAARPDAENGSVKERVLSRLERNLEFFTLYPDYYKCIVLLYYLAAIDRGHRKMNTALVATAVTGLEVPLRERLSPERARIAAESLHNELIASIQKFYMTVHAEKPDAFVRRMSDYFSERIDAIISTPA